MTLDQYKLLMGSACGDLHLIQTKSGAALRFGHGQDQLPYLNAKARIMEPYPRAPLDSYLNKKTNTYYYRIYFHSKKEFQEVRDVFYEGQKKWISAKVIDGLARESWAFWYGDDGSLSNQRATGRSDTARIYIGKTNLRDGEEQKIKEIMERKFGPTHLSLVGPTRAIWDFHMNVVATQEFGKVVNPTLQKVFPEKKILLL